MPPSQARTICDGELESAAIWISTYSNKMTRMVLCVLAILLTIETFHCFFLTPLLRPWKEYTGYALSGGCWRPFLRRRTFWRAILRNIHDRHYHRVMELESSWLSIAIRLKGSRPRSIDKVLRVEKTYGKCYLEEK